MPTNTEVFCTVYDYVVVDYIVKADLSKGCGNPKRKFGVEIIKQQLLQTAVQSKAMYGGFFFSNEALSFLKNPWLPPIFFLNTKSTC